MKTVGKHLLVDLIACKAELLKKVDFIDKIMFEAAKIAKATVVGKFFKQFDPYGVSGVIVIAESHFTIHTWPEHGLASVDFFSCTEEVDMFGAVSYLKDKLEAKELISTEISRGNMNILSIYNNKISETANNEILL